MMKRTTFREFLNEYPNFFNDVGIGLFEESPQDFVTKKELDDILNEYIKITSIVDNEDNTFTITWEEK